MDFARKSGGTELSREIGPGIERYAKLHGCGGGRHGGVDESVGGGGDGEGRKLDGETRLLEGEKRALHVLIIMASYWPSLEV